MYQFYHYFVLIHFYIGMCEEKHWLCKTSQISRKQGRNAVFEIDFVTNYPYPESTKVGMFKKNAKNKVSNCSWNIQPISFTVSILSRDCLRQQQWWNILFTTNLLQSRKSSVLLMKECKVFIYLFLYLCFKFYKNLEIHLFIYLFCFSYRYRLLLENLLEKTFHDDPEFSKLSGIY